MRLKTKITLISLGIIVIAAMILRLVQTNQEIDNTPIDFSAPDEGLEDFNNDMLIVMTELDKKLADKEELAANTNTASAQETQKIQLQKIKEIFNITPKEKSSIESPVEYLPANHLREA